MGAPGAVAILNRRDIAAADDPDADAAAARGRVPGPATARRAIAAERGYVDQVIDPRATRAHLVAAFARLAGKRPGPSSAATRHPVLTTPPC